MSEAPRQIQQNAGETRARGTATDAVEHFRALPRRAEEEQNRHQPALKVAVLPWRFCPTFLGVMRWRTKDAPDCAMRCRLALSQNFRRSDGRNPCGRKIDYGETRGCTSLKTPGER